MSISRGLSYALALAALASCSPDESSQTDNLSNGSALSGAIFTTTVDGRRIDANIYAAKTDVYLDGGPGANAPRTAAALPDGNYYFQVTDPSGKTLLSSDAIACREIHFTNGMIDSVATTACPQPHATGTDMNDGGLTVQLMPYDDTPNPGGEYKVWVTPVDRYDTVDNKFVHRYSKTDNFKVRVTTPPPVDAGVPDAPCDAPPPPPPVDACPKTDVVEP